MKGRKKVDLHDVFHEKSREPLLYKKMTKKEFEVFKEKLKQSRIRTTIFQFTIGLILTLTLSFYFIKLWAL